MADERTPLLGSSNVQTSGATVQHSSKASKLRLQAAATLGASLLGTGLLAQPKACSSTGLFLFAILSFAAVSLSHLTAMMLCRTFVHLSAMETSAKPASYSDVVAIVLGHRGELFTMWIIALMQIGCCVGYVVVIGDVFTPLIAHWSHDKSQLSNAQIIYIATAAVLMPLCIGVRKLTSLRYTSAVAMLVIMFFGGVVVGNGIYIVSSSDSDELRKDLIDADEYDDIDLSGPNLFPQDVAALSAIPLISFAYFMHFNVLPVFKTLTELGNEEALRIYSAASLTSFMLSGTVTCAFGIFGYLTFLSTIESDILSNFRVSGSYISSFLNIVRAMYGMGLMLAFPVVLWEARENLKKIMFGGDLKKAHSASATSHSPGILEEFTVLDDTTSSYDDRLSQIPSIVEKPLRDTFKMHAAFSFGLVLLTAVLGASVTNLEVVFGLIGSTCTPAIAYILPAMVYIKSGAAAKADDDFQAKMALGIGAALVPFGLTIWVLGRMGTI